MREAKYARLQAAAGPAKAGPTKAAPPKAAPPKAVPAKTAKPKPSADVVAAETPAAGACGHKSMNGRACTREQGHPQKSHRYS